MYNLGLPENRESYEAVIPEKKQDTSVNDLWEQGLKEKEQEGKSKENIVRVLGSEVDGPDEKKRVYHRKMLNLISVITLKSS